MATNISLGSLMSMGMVEIAMDSDWNGNEYTVYRLRNAGIEWLSTNKDKLKLTTHYDEDDYTPAGGGPPPETTISRSNLPAPAHNRRWWGFLCAVELSGMNWQGCNSTG